MLYEQKRIDLQIRQEIRRKEYEKEIEEMNFVELEEEVDERRGKKRTAEEVLAELCEEEEEEDYTDTLSDDNDSLLDADSLDFMIDDFKETEISKSNLKSSSLFLNRNLI